MFGKTKIQHFFDLWAARYEADLETNGYAVPDIFEHQILPFIRDQQQNEFPQILDIGIGTGISARSLKKLGNCFITGMDSSKKMLGQCQNGPHGKSADEFIHFDCNKPFWPIPGDAYDIVSAIGVFEYIYDPRAFLRQMHQAVKQRGLVILSYETTENLPSYKAGLICGVTHQDDTSVTIRRRAKGSLMPLFYKKYLYNRDYMKALFENEDLNVLFALEDEKTYEWPGHTPITHDYFILQKR